MFRWGKTEWLEQKENEAYMRVEREREETGVQQEKETEVRESE